METMRQEGDIFSHQFCEREREIDGETRRVREVEREGRNEERDKE